MMMDHGQEGVYHAGKTTAVGVHDPSYGIASYLYAAEQEVEERIPLAERISVKFLRLTELGSLCLCFSWPMWYIKPSIIIWPMLVVKLVNSRIRIGSFLEPLMSPLKLGLPSKYSFFGLHPGQKGARNTYAWSMARCLIMLWLSSHSFDRLKGDTTKFGCENRMGLGNVSPSYTEEEFTQVPRWIVPGPMPSKYIECANEQHWWSNRCNYLVAEHCHLSKENDVINVDVGYKKINELIGPINVGRSVADTVFHIIQALFPVLGCLYPLATLMHWWIAGVCPWTCVEEPEMLQAIRQRQSKSRKGRPFSAAVIFVVIRHTLDLLTDINSVRTFMILGHTKFAMISWTFIIFAIRDTLFLGGPFRMIVEAYRCYKRGFETDEFIKLIRTEMTVEALPNLLLQVYAYPYCTSDAISFYIFPVSIITSFVQVTTAMHQECELGLQTVFPEHIVSAPDWDKMPNASITFDEDYDEWEDQPRSCWSCCMGAKVKKTPYKATTVELVE